MKIPVQWNKVMSYFDIRGRLIVINLLLYITYFFAPYFYQKIYSQDVLNFIFYSPIEPVFALSTESSKFVFAFHFMSALLLFLRFLYAEYIYLCVIFMHVIIVGLGGIHAYTGFDMLLLLLMDMSAGVIIYLSFFNGNNRYS